MCIYGLNKNKSILWHVETNLLEFKTFKDVSVKHLTLIYTFEAIIDGFVVILIFPTVE